MIKKVIIASLFLGGGYLFIKKILPNFTKKEFQVDTTSIEERLAEEERLRKKQAEDIRKSLVRKFGTDKNLNDLNTIMFAPKIDYGDAKDFGELIFSYKNLMTNLN